MYSGTCINRRACDRGSAIQHPLQDWGTGSNGSSRERIFIFVETEFGWSIHGPLRKLVL